MLRLTILLLLIVLPIRSMGFVSRASLDFCERKSLLVRCWLQCRFGCCSKIGSIIEQVTDGMYLLEALGSRPSCNMEAEDCVLLSPQLRTIEGGSVRAPSHLETLGLSLHFHLETPRRQLHIQVAMTCSQTLQFAVLRLGHDTLLHHMSLHHKTPAK